MHSLHFTILVLAASAAAPALSAPIVNSPVARHSAPSGGDIRHLLRDLNLRSEDIGAGLYGRDDRSPYSPLDARDGDLIPHEITPQDYSGGIESSKPERDYLAGRNFFGNILNGAEDVADGVVNDAEDVVTGTAEGFDALGNGIKNAVNQRDYLAGYIQARKDFFTKVLDGAGDIVDGTVNDAEDVVTGTAEGFDALGNGIKNAVNQRDYLAGDIRARNFFSNILNGAEDVADGVVNDAEDVVTGTAEGFDALGNGIENAINQ